MLSILNPTLSKLGWISFVGDLASEMLYPITPIFLTATLGASMTSLGLMEGLAEAVASFIKVYAGRWSDQIRKRVPFIVSGYFLSGISRPLIGLASSWFYVFIARSLDRIGKGLRTAPRDALIAESVSKNQLALAFGWHRAMDTLGATLGPLIAILALSTYPNDLRPIYFWALIPGMIAVLIALRIRESHPKEQINHPTDESEIETRNSHSQSKKYKNFFTAWMVFSLANSTDAFLLLKVKESGHSLIVVILLYCLYNLIYALSSPILGQYADQFGKRKILKSGLLLFAIVYACFSQAHQIWQYAILFALYGLYMGATEGVGKALASEAYPQKKATGIGVLVGMTGLTTIFASTFAGVLWDQVGSHAPFIYGASGAILAFMILTLGRTTREKERNIS